MVSKIVKIFISGEGGVGKTTMIDRLIHGKFNADTLLTIGCQHSMYYAKSPNGKDDIGLQIWDLGGEERFKVIIPIYVQGSHGGIIVFDESRFQTWAKLPELIAIVKKNLDKDTPLILVSTKSDLVEEPLLQEDEVKSFLEEYGFSCYLRTSAKTGENVKEVFDKLLEALYEMKKI